MVKILQFVNNPIPSNCYVVYDNSFGNQCLLVDPGCEDVSDLCDYLNSQNLQPQYILLTHEHFDHCWGVNSIRKKYMEVKLICSADCSTAIQDRKKNYSVFYEQPGFEIAAADVEITQDICLDLINHRVCFAIAQGHSTSGLIIGIDNYLFTGDELIKDVRTVTKLKTGSKEKLKESFAFLESLKGKNFLVCPGHGEMFRLDNYIF